MAAPYLPVNRIVTEYGLSRSTVYDLINEMKSCDRYKGQWVTVDGVKTSVNVLVLEDYLRYRQFLKQRNFARNIPPYSAAEVRRQRGDR